MTLNEAKELFPEVSKERPENAIGYIYVTFEPISGKFYIGKHTSYKWHDYYYGGGYYPKIWKKEELNLYHWPIQWCYSKEGLSEAEYSWINKYKCYSDIANLVEGGDREDTFPKVISNELRQKLSDILLTIGNPRKGKHYTEEEKENLRQKAIERCSNPAYMENLVKKLKEYYKHHDGKALGRKHTQKERDKMSAKKAELFNRSKTDYTPDSDSANKYLNMKLKVICLDTGEIFNSLVDANMTYGNKKGHISDVCKGRRRTAFGKRWRFLDNDLSIIEPEDVKTSFIADIKPKGKKIKVQCVETGEIFDSVSNANRFLGNVHGRGNVIKACKGQIDSCGGYHWRYYIEENSEPFPLPDYSYSNELGFLERKTCLA